VPAVLPIELSYFGAKRINEGIVEITWQTLLEKNNKYFAIQASADGLEWKELGVVEGRLNSSTATNYIFYDKQFISSSYYRLKQVDRDGSFSYSAIKYVEYSSIAEARLLIYPNPSNGTFNLKLVGFQNKTSLKFSLLSAQGEMIFQDLISFDKDQSIVHFGNTEKLNPGLYFCLLKAGDKVFVEKIIVTH